MLCLSAVELLHRVALRKESVDRNAMPISSRTTAPRSLSARRAWIEIYRAVFPEGSFEVALRKESVDRNLDVNRPTRRATSRSPQGERG